jgi:hypothetical protein
MRLYTGAGLSTLDLCTDMFMIYTYATTGELGTAVKLACMVGLCLLGQLFTVWVQNHKGPRRVMLKEMLIVLTGLKVGFSLSPISRSNPLTPFRAARLGCSARGEWRGVERAERDVTGNGADDDKRL